MNWLEKIATITFSLGGSHKISRPKTVDDLGYDLLKFVHEKYGDFMGTHDIGSDGDDLGKMTGKINWYVSDKVPEDQQMRIMQEWIQEMSLMDYQMQISGPERSGMNNWNPDPNKPDLMVYRIHVLQNGSEDYMQIPEMNMANSNAHDVMNAIGVQFDWTGSVALNELQTKLEMFTPYHQQELIREPEHSQEEGKVQMIDFGRDEDRVERYIGGLRRMVEFGLKNGFETLTWS